MREMWKLDDGYMTVEASMIVPAALMILYLFIGYVCYFMNCGIIQGTMEAVTLKGADTALYAGSWEHGEISYEQLNEKNLYQGNSGDKNTAARRVREEIKKELSAHLFLCRVEQLKVTAGTLGIKTEIKAALEIPGSYFLSGFGIRFFQYEGSYYASYLSEMEKIRRWNAIERAVD